jgi:hypothetical protein
MGSEEGLNEGERQKEDASIPEITIKWLDGDTGEEQERKKEEGTKNQPGKRGVKERGGDHQEAAEFAPGIPAVKNRIHGEVMKGYSLSHVSFSPPIRE